jgi:hypothetical protein
VVVAGEGDARLEASRSAAVEDDPCVGAVWGAADPGLVGELLEGNRRSACERVAVRHHEVEWVVQQVCALQFNVRLAWRPT